MNHMLHVYQFLQSLQPGDWGSFLEEEGEQQQQPQQQLQAFPNEEEEGAGAPRDWGPGGAVRSPSGGGGRHGGVALVDDGTGQVGPAFLPATFTVACLMQVVK